MGLDIGLAFLTLLSGLVFYSLIYDDKYGYQLYYAFLLIPLLTVGQFFKIFFLLKSNTPKYLFLISILVTFLFYIPLSDAWTHNEKITYPLSTTVYFGLTVFYIIEIVYFRRQNNKIQDISNS